MDAIAVALATRGACLGAAPLGTSLTGPQARQLAVLDAQPIIATDSDAAGLAAAERDYWILAALSANPLFAELPDDTDPAEVLHSGQAATLAKALDDAEPLGPRLIDGRVLSGQPDDLLETTRVLAAMPPNSWRKGLGHIADSTGLPETLVRVALASAVAAWNQNPERAAELWCVDQHMGSGREGPHPNRGVKGAAINGPTGPDLPARSVETRPALGAP